MVDNKEPGMAKAAMVEKMIKALGSGDMTAPVGRGAMKRGEERKFQELRYHWLIWGIENPEGCVRERIRRLEKKIPPEYRGVKYQSMVGIPPDVMMLYSQIEDMEIVLGLHLAQSSGPRCPECLSISLSEIGNRILCGACGHSWER
jgi:hypothetical protein